MNPFTQRVSDLLPNQVHKKAIVVDARLRVKGAPLGEVYAIGDCATVRVPPFVLIITYEMTQNGIVDRDFCRQPFHGACGRGRPGQKWKN